MMRSLIPKPIQPVIALLIGALLITGCSSSSTESATGGQTSGTDGGAVTDPLVQNSTRVDFEVTVPAYQSDALQVKLTWGEKELVAEWVGDELWTASDVFPSNAAQPLIVTFYDDNGDITLGSYEAEFKTGVNTSESYNITADQFDTNRWDEDSDGVSNINELITGTNPLLNETLVLEVREQYNPPEALEVLGRVSGFYESSVPAERPYNEHHEEQTQLSYDPYTPGISSIVNIDIDASGTGSYSDEYESMEPSDVTRENKTATRTRSNNVITWMGNYKRTNSSASVSEAIEFTTETQAIDEQTRKQSGVIDRNTSGYVSSANTPMQITYTLTGKAINDSSNCEPVAGSVTFDGQYDLSTGSVDAQTTISKDIDDQYWTVSVATLNGEVAESYLVQSIATTFYCDFGD